MHLPVLSPEFSAAWDGLAEAAGIPMRALMESAGRAVATLVAARFAERMRQGVLVACGSGNNGGDGWVAARALHAVGVPVWVTSSDPPAGDLARAVCAVARHAGVREVGFDGPWPGVGLVVDAVLGSGARGAPRDSAQRLLGRIADLGVPVVAVDGPSGLDLSDGVQHGPVHAALTVSFGGYHRGHLLARDDVGDLVAVDIGLPPPPSDWPVFLCEAAAAALAPPFKAAVHKGERGRVVVVGGSDGLTGAARLTARAAFAAGAGFVHLIVPPSSVPLLSAAEPDLQIREQSFDQPLSRDTVELLSKADVLVIGPGLGRADDRATFVANLLQASGAGTPAVVDADGLAAFAGRAGALGAALRGRPALLTPHAGEYRGLFPGEASRLGTDPWGAAEAAARAIGVPILLKGVPTVLAAPRRPTLTVAAGNPGLGTGGSGDTLSGLIGTLLAQGLEPLAAGAAAAYAMGEAADAAARRTSARSMRPMDVIAAVPDVWRRWDLVRRAPPPPRPPVLHELPAPIRV